jgi:nucleotide-binding universal stress UspA family protein
MNYMLSIPEAKGEITMKDIKKILFPIDFSKVSPLIADWVRTIAEKFGAEIHLLFIARRLGHFSTIDVSEDSISSFESEIIRAGENSMEAFVNTHFSGYPACQPRVELGDAAEEILNYIKAKNIDLVIMGTHGRKGLDRVIFGSVANTVIKKAQAPVMSINPYTIPELKNN